MARPRRRAPETIAFLGDIHAGSWWGLWPRSRLPGDGFLGPRYLLDCWDDLQRRWPKKLDLLILAGDLIEGPQRGRLRAVPSGSGRRHGPPQG